MNRVFVVFLSLMFLCAAAFAQGEGQSPEDMQKMMEEWMKIAAPGPAHDLMKAMTGEWNCATKSWMGPDQPPMDSPPGLSNQELIFGGRYLKTEHSGEIMGMPFHGLGYLGYDNFRQQYWMTWFDDMGTALLTAYGTTSPDGKELTLLGKSDDPMSGEKDKDTKYYYRFVDDKTIVFEIWDMTAEPDFKMMEMIYTKK